MAAGAEPSRVTVKVAALLSRGDGGELSFSPEARARVAALVEVAARLTDAPRGAAALEDLVRLAVALRGAGHTRAAGDLQDALRQSPPALRRLERARQKSRAVHRRFERFSDRVEAKTAPRIDAPRPDSGVELRDLLPPTMGRRLGR